jgi:hypothetical protein
VNSEGPRAFFLADSDLADTVGVAHFTSIPVDPRLIEGLLNDDDTLRPVGDRISKSAVERNAA